MKFVVPLMMPAIHSMRFAVRPSRKALMIGMPPATAASNATITPCLRAASKISVPCTASSALLAAADPIQHELARDRRAADQLDDDVDRRILDDGARIGNDARVVADQG